jgi:hypothetical protein
MLLLSLLLLLLCLHSPLLDCGSFFSFLILYKVGYLGRGMSPSQGLYLNTEEDKQRTNAHNKDIHVLSGIQTHDPSVRASEDSSFFRRHSHCDRRLKYVPAVLILRSLNFDHRVMKSFVWSSELSAIISMNIISWLVFVMETWRVFCNVGSA